MSRPRRFLVPGQTYFLLLEGHDGCSCFYDDACYRYYLARLNACLSPCHVRLHAYVLLSNEIQLLLTPATPTGTSHLMKLTGGAYVQYFNNRFSRQGGLWKGRFRSSLIQSDLGLVDCHRYMEQAPLRRGVATAPAEYPWSSYTANAFGGSRVLSLHRVLRDRLATGGGRFQAYRDLLREQLAPARLARLDQLLRLGHALIDVDYQAGRVTAIKKTPGTPTPGNRTAAAG